MTRTYILVFWCLFVCSLSICTVAKATQYSLHVLDAPQGCAYNTACKINDNGVIVGIAASDYNSRNNAGVYYLNAAGVQSAGITLRNNNHVNINNDGVIVGGPWVSSNGNLSPLTRLLPIYGSNLFVDINNTGVVVGASSYNLNGDLHAALWDSQGLHDLGTLTNIG